MFGRNALTLALASMLWAAPAFAQETLYVTDHLRITVRSGPSNENKVLATTQTGQKVTLLGSEKEGWVLVRLSDGKEGWLLKRFLVKEPPAALRLAQMSPDKKGLGSRLEDLQRENQRLANTLNEARAAASQLQARYNKLKRESADFLKLKEELVRLQKENVELAAKIKELSVEKQSLEFSHDLKWFLGGASVLVVGWFMGLALHRRKKRWESSLY
jgi:SH3 domain protein